MNKEQLDRIEKNQKEIIQRLKLLDKALNSILPTPITYREVSEDELIGLMEACKFLGKSESTVSKWSLDGVIPFHYRNGKRKYSISELQAWITHRPSHNK